MLLYVVSIDYEYEGKEILGIWTDKVKAQEHLDLVEVNSIRESKEIIETESDVILPKSIW